MKIIVGLGNPGKQYEKTKHNAGFIVVDAVAKALSVDIKTKKFKALIAETFVNGEKIVLVKPQTYMNLSGESVREVMNFYHADLGDLMIISDDKDLELGRIRIRPQGSSGGQNGLKNIISHLGTQDFARLKVGIGRKDIQDTVDYVMRKIEADTEIGTATQAILDFIKGASVAELMNHYNQRKST